MARVVIYVAAASLGGGLGCLVHIAAHRMTGDRGLASLTGAMVGFGVTVLIMHFAGAL